MEINTSLLVKIFIVVVIVVFLLCLAFVRYYATFFSFGKKKNDIETYNKTHGLEIDRLEEEMLVDANEISVVKDEIELIKKQQDTLKDEIKSLKRHLKTSKEETELPLEEIESLPKITEPSEE